MLLDDTTLQQLEQDASLEVMPEIVSIFLRETRSRLVRILEAAEQKNLACVESESHTT